MMVARHSSNAAPVRDVAQWQEKEKVSSECGKPLAEVAICKGGCYMECIAA